MADDAGMLFEDDPSQEDEDDLEATDPSVIEEAVLNATDWTTETLVSQLRRGNIDLNPRFQRRDAWNPVRKSRFIESILLGLPIPQIVLAERKSQRGTYLVIDGKQRLLALSQFAEGADSLKLSGLEVRKNLNGLGFDDFTEEGFGEDVNEFDNRTIRTVVVKSWPDEDFLYRVFLRLNTGSVPLSPQELRQALHPGPFVDFLDDFSYASQALQDALGLAKADFRMRDVELLLRYFAFAYFLSRYRGNLKAFLDMTCEELNSSWDDDEGDFREEAANCEAAIATTIEIFGDHAFRRWNGTRYEGRFNRAVFDVMAFYFDDDSIARKAKRRPKVVRDAFQKLSEDREFTLAVQTTTKTIPAVATRLAAWGTTLAEAIDVDIDVPRLVDDHIEY
jgi:hypothetical protein